MSGRTDVKVSIQTRHSTAERSYKDGGSKSGRASTARSVCERQGEREIIIPKLRTAFVFIWHDCLHVLLLAAVGEREGGRGGQRGGGEKEMKALVKRQTTMEKDGGKRKALVFFCKGR